MARNDELLLFVVRVPGAQFQLMSEDGTVVVEAENWRGLRRKLDLLLESEGPKPVKVVICVGRPRPVSRPVSPPSRPHLVPVQLPCP
jgi:hypothetical protein